MVVAINEDRVLSLIKYFVAKPESILKELVQNSRRAKAKNVNITLKDNELIYTDDGNGISNYKSLLVLGETSWDNEIVEDETPAGFGFYSLISHAKSIDVNYGDLVIDCPLFLKDSQYRETILNKIESLPIREGFHLEAILLPGVRLNGTDDNLRYFEDMNIYVNGDKKNTISAEVIAEQLGNEFIRTQYEGNDLFIKKGIYIYGNNGNIKNLSQLIIYRGEPIHVGREYIEYSDNNSDNNIVYIIKQGSPLNIQLPFRDNIIRDDKYDKFIKFCKDTLISYAREVIKKKDEYHLKNNDDDDDVYIIMRAMIKNECDGLLLEYTKDNLYNRYGDSKCLILTKPEKIEKIEEILGSKIVMLKRGDDFEIASDKLRIIIPYARQPIHSRRDILAKILKYLKGIDIIHVDTIPDIPFIPYSKLKHDEYMIGAVPRSTSRTFPVLILVRNENDITKLWPKIKDSKLLYGCILTSAYINDDVDWSEQVYSIIDDIDEAVCRKYDELGFIVNKLYDIIEEYGYGNKISKKKIRAFVEEEVQKGNGSKRRKENT
jgi:hypothetical protein